MKHDLTGQTFGRLTVVSRIRDKKSDKPVWYCRCVCGGVARVLTYSLRSGESQSCGCYRNERTRETKTTHGLSSHAIYRLWGAICYRSRAQGFGMDPRWTSFEAFLSDVGMPPSPKHRLLRLDKSKGYSVDNCIWQRRWGRRRSVVHLKDRAS